MKHIYMTASTIEGFGMHAGEDISRGEQICRIYGDFKSKVVKNTRDALANPNWVGVGKNQWIDPAAPTRFMNHSCDPNMGIKGRLTLVAIKDIEAGDELTIDYSIIEGEPRWCMECSCGSKDCRRVINSIQFLPMKQFQNYMPFIPKYFQKIYEISQS